MVSIKSLVVFYKAHGSNASWEWIESVAPCVDVLRQLSKNFNDILGADQGTRHAPANLNEDIATLMESLDENDVYRISKGRVLDDDNEPVKDVIATGLQNLVEGNKNHFLSIMRLSGTSKPDDEGNQSFLDQPKRKRLQWKLPRTLP